MKEYRSTLAELIQSAVNDCIENGSGKANKPNDINDGVVVAAEWDADNENDITITISQCGHPMCVYIEHGVAGKVWRADEA